ncbi:MAG: hypothetical protein AAGF48_09450 [Pseudomonadota bacterium]
MQVGCLVRLHFFDQTDVMTNARVIAAAIAVGLGMSVGAQVVFAGNDDAAFGGECVMGLALGKDIQTDCSVNTVYLGKKYCFGNETARKLFLKRPDDFLLQAFIYHSSREEAAADAAKQAESD